MAGHKPFKDVREKMSPERRAVSAQRTQETLTAMRCTESENEEKPARRALGTAAGKFHVPDDFNAPLPDDLQAAFEGDNENEAQQLNQDAQRGEERKARIERGRRFYDEQLKAILEPQEIGHFVAIEPETGRYFIGDTSTAALAAAHATMPEELFYLKRVGYNAAHTIRGHGARRR